MAISQDIEKLRCILCDTPHLRRVGDDLVGAQNVMGIIRSLLGDDAIIDDLIGLPDFEFGPLDEIREIALEKGKIGIPRPCAPCREMMGCQMSPQMLEKFQTIGIVAEPLGSRDPQASGTARSSA